MGRNGFPLFAAVLGVTIPAFPASFVNSVWCQSSATCATTWNVSAGGLLAVYRWSPAALGDLSDSQGNGYTTLRNLGTYRSISGLSGTLAGAAGVVTVTSTVIEPNILIAEFSGVSLALDAAASYGLGGDHAACPPAAPLTVTADTDVLLLSTWVLDGQRTNGCSWASGTAIGGSCPPAGGLTGQLNYQFGAAGGYTQQFSFDPSFNAGNGNCGFYALKLATVISPPKITGFTATPSTVDSGAASLLHWDITGADSASIDHGIGSVSPVSGDFTVYPSVATTYTLTASGPGGVVTGTVSISVNGTQTGTIDRPTLVNLLGLTPGSGIQIVDTGAQIIISRPLITGHCIPQSGSVWTVTQQQHGRTDDGLTVAVYDDSKPRNALQAGWTMDPDTLTVTVTFAAPQTGCVVVR